MSATNRIADITDDAWVEIATGPAYVLIELDQPIAPPVLVRVGATLPGTEVLDGFRLTDDRRTLEFESLGASDKLYARSTGGTVSLVVVSADTSSLETLVGSTNSRIGATNDAAAANDTATGSVIAFLKRIAANISDTNLNFGIQGDGAAASDTAVASYISLFKRLLAKITAGVLLKGRDGINAASETNPVPAVVFDKTINVAGTTLTRPANTTAYAAGDSISDNTTAASVIALPATVADINDATVMITELLLETTDTGLAAGVPIEVEVFNSDPTVSSGVGSGDNAAYSNKRAGWVGRFQGVFVPFSDGGKAVCVPADGQAFSIINPESGGKRLWCQYKTLGGFTPSANSTTIGIRFKGLQGRA